MDDRRKLAHELDEMQQQMKELEILYEQYFAGIERREPLNTRKDLARRVRQFTNRHIVWTDLKFRYHGITSRFMSYCQYWDRILRLMDEGKYHRHTAKLHAPPPAATANTPAERRMEVESLHRQMQQARKECGLAGDGPSVEKITGFLESQREQIRSRYGDRAVEFSIETQDGKPRIKVRLKK